MSDERRRIDVNWVQASAGALAAVSSAVLLSTVGVAGTIIGAALGSLVATVGGSIYSHYLQVSRERVASVAAARSQVRRARVDLREAQDDLALGTPRADERLEQATEELHVARHELSDAEEDVVDDPVRWQDTLAGLPWKRLLIGALTLFVAAMLAIIAFELIAGRSVSSFTGGTGKDGPRISVPGVGGGTRETPTPTPTSTPSPGGTPTGEATPTAAPTTSTPTPTATPTPAATDTSAPAPTATTSAVPSPAATTSATSPTG